MTRKMAIAGAVVRGTTKSTSQRAVLTALVLSVALLVLGGCRETGEGGSARLRAPQKPEYDCRKSADKICKVPWKDKIVLYCYKGKIPKVVRYDWECK